MRSSFIWPKSMGYPLECMGRTEWLPDFFGGQCIHSFTSYVHQVYCLDACLRLSILEPALVKLACRQPFPAVAHSCKAERISDLPDHSLQGFLQVLKFQSAPTQQLVGVMYC